MALRDALVRVGLVKSAADKALRELAARPIAEARGRARIRGVVQAIESPLSTPFTGRDAVFWAVEHLHNDVITVHLGRRGEDEKPIWRQRLRSGAMTAFDVVDDAGARARVSIPSTPLEAALDTPFMDDLREPSPLRRAMKAAQNATNATWIERSPTAIAITAAGVTFELDASSVADSPRLNELPPDLEAFFRSHGVTPTRHMGLLRENRFREAAIAPGVVAEIVGEIEPSRDEQALGGYRGGDSVVLVRPQFIVVR